MRFSSYVFFSILAMIFMVYYAYYTRKQFYPTVLYLVSSKIAFVITSNLVIAFGLVIARIVKAIYFGSLRDTEVEVLIEKAKYSVVETALALTIFRNELTPVNTALFGAVILFKLLHKLSKYRLEYMEQIAPVPTFTQVRMGALLANLLLVDALGVAFAVSRIMENGKSVLILFGFEFGLLLVYAFNLTIRFVIQLVDNWMVNGLQSRGLLIMLVDMLCDVIKLMTYVAFFGLVWLNYGLPFHLIRDLWSTFFSFQRKFVGFIKYLKLSRNLDNRFPDATAEEVANAGHCLVCREEMDRGKKLPCGHVFHLDCLRLWLQHQQTCPLCRAEIPTTPQQQDILPRPEIVVPLEQPQQQPPQVPAAVPPLDVPPPPVPQQARQHDALERGPLHSRTEPSQPVAPSTPSTRAFFGDAEETTSQPAKAFIVLRDGEAFVHKDPSSRSPALRPLSKGTVLMVTLQVQAEGVQWLKLPDGWVADSTLRGRWRQQRVISPLLKEINSAYSSVDETEKGPVEELIREQLLLHNQKSSRAAISQPSCLPFSAGSRLGPLLSRSASPVCEFSSSDSSRLDQILSLQNQVSSLAQQMNHVNESLLACQTQLNRLLKGDQP
eukprot:scaffold2208_cov170-Ochromonas_danica.AAC.23